MILYDTVILLNTFKYFNAGLINYDVVWSCMILYERFIPKGEK